MTSVNVVSHDAENTVLRVDGIDAFSVFVSLPGSTDRYELQRTQDVYRSYMPIPDGEYELTTDGGTEMDPIMADGKQLKVTLAKTS